MLETLTLSFVTCHMGDVLLNNSTWSVQYQLD
jgi:hypothetical protein